MIRRILTGNDASHIEDTGDGFLASFRSVGSAVGATMAIQYKVEERDTIVAPPFPSEVRLTLAVGELYDRDGKRDGVTLVETARLEELTGAREVLCTGAFRTLAEEVAPGLFRHRADVVLRGLGHTTDVWEFDWRPAGRIS